MNIYIKDNGHEQHARLLQKGIEKKIVETKPVEVIEMDELYSFVDRKNKIHLITLVS